MTTFDNLMMQVGYLFLRWGFLENELRARGLNLSSTLTIPGMENARLIRNAIAHGIWAASAHPHNSDTPHLICRLQDGGEHRVSYADLVAAIETLEVATIEVRRSL